MRKIYYQAKPASDQTRCSIRSKNRILVANELYTAGEVEYAIQKGWTTQQFIDKHLTKIELPANSTHFFFGARFMNSDVTANTIQ